MLGSLRHAVTRYASDLAEAVDALMGAADSPRAVAPAVGAAGSAVRVETAGEVIGAVAGIHNLHLQFTDRLFGQAPELAADLVEELARSARVTVTLHDLPQPSDGAKNLPRRAAAYARVAEAAAGVVCNSRHEALLLAEYSAPHLTREVAVIPLPVGAGGSAMASVPVATPMPLPMPLPLREEAAILGFFYPGKGHAELIDAVARSGLDVTVTALGTAAPGHEAELAAVSLSAREVGVRFECTGYLTDAELLERCHRIAVPVAAHQHLSASASINTWIEAGRRPLVPTGRYTRELDELRPGTVTLYDPDLLPLALAVAAAEPASTWIAPGTSIRPHPADTAERYLAWWQGLG
ncbi:hypothetical protein B7R21_14615 [Subtercola boreus]|uniref:Glycosyltransferase subfamily 4-like N-terminal domain-containing protein n=1 Tax=Subtercola boreus TaxID=120213 RepID=A0A3E0VCP7_9MICO|nr:hypothetical protein B7R21_14615 [Subtercola boreus]